MRIGLKKTIIFTLLASSLYAGDVKKVDQNKATLSKEMALRIENSDLKLSNYSQYISSLQMAIRSASAQAQEEKKTNDTLKEQVIKEAGFDKNKSTIDTTARTITQAP